ncbi:unnamed protein product [Zymoseptoria tritici ST99CH_1E4]|uniref:Heterokaryon incompatibility domain-containing protein n=1 Tax=Zymoseptoria tritici ST99CH_1E4 TaxID=1276532 RepID=A0A2H1H0E8_ZYMTR|nr:unnamed protein product [Zymoseptoria tritici ST99CH_1E4]
MALPTVRGLERTIFEPVDAAKKEFRLLKILPGHKTSPVRVLLANECLHNAPPFAALSYTWGQDDPNCHIEVNSGMLPVTKNLLRFLMQVRQLPAHASRYFWTDAICVDQTNLEERGQQVSLMADIYSSAALVVLWLGPAYEGSDLGMRAFTRIRTTTQSDDTKSQILWRSREGTAIRRLCERRYWTRLWVLQELALADRKIDIMCGGKVATWIDFTSVILHIRTPLGSRAESQYTYERIMKSPARAMFIQASKTSADSRLLDHILSARHLQCSDPRDKVYGVLGIAKLTKAVPISADYNLDLVRLAYEVLQHEFAENLPTGLDALRQTCQITGNILGISVSSILSCQDLVISDLAERALLNRSTGIDVRSAV